MNLRATTTEPSTSVASRPSNAEVIGKIRAHHRELADQLRERTRAVLTAAEYGDLAGPRSELHEWYRTTLVPHAVAEEQVLYSAGSGLAATRLLIQAMLGEHRALVSLIADLALAREPFRTAIVAASAQALFDTHLDKENDLLLPALDDAGLDLATLLDGMHDILGSTDVARDDAGCGCGCNHDAAPVAATELDVRQLPHGQRHEIIFGRLDALAPGDELVIVNDHDPKPLCYQTEALWPERFAWTYREAGPEVWRVAISRAR